VVVIYTFLEIRELKVSGETVEKVPKQILE